MQVSAIDYDNQWMNTGNSIRFAALEAFGASFILILMLVYSPFNKIMMIFFITMFFIVGLGILRFYFYTRNGLVTHFHNRIPKRILLSKLESYITANSYNFKQMDDWLLNIIFFRTSTVVFINGERFIFIIARLSPEVRIYISHYNVKLMKVIENFFN